VVLHRHVSLWVGCVWIWGFFGVAFIVLQSDHKPNWTYIQQWNQHQKTLISTHSPLTVKHVYVTPHIVNSTYQHEAMTSRSRELLMKVTWLPEICWATIRREIKNTNSLNVLWAPWCCRFVSWYSQFSCNALCMSENIFHSSHCKTLLTLFVHEAAKSSGTWWRLAVRGGGGGEGGVMVMCLFLGFATGALDKNRSHFVNSVLCRSMYTGCNRRNVPDFGRVFLMLNYTDITQNTYIQSWTVTEIMAIEVCGASGGVDVLYAVRDVILVQCACPRETM
jgi:hypothetical protein